MGNVGGGGAAFLGNNMNDPAVLRKMIAELELENKKLKEGGGSQQFSQSFSGGMKAGGDKDWMKGFN